MESLENALLDIKEQMPRLDLRENEVMKDHCSFKVGGPVRAYAAPNDLFELSKLTYILHNNDVAPLMLGKGTNIIIPDEGLDIIVISTENLGKVKLGVEENTVYAEAGVSMARLAQFAQQNGLAGLEFASGIPGSVGGGVIMNAGAYGSEMKDVVRSVVLYYLPDQVMLEAPNENCDFSYRHSIFQEYNCAVMAVVFKLTPDDPDAIAARMREMNEKRRNSQPLDLPSCGSAFKRPVGGYAAALIDRCGLKGYTVGGAQISEKHAGFAVNRGGATYDDVVELLDHVRRTVYEQTKVTLEPEIKIYPKGMLLVDDWRIRKASIMKEMEALARVKADAANQEKKD